MNQNNTYVIIYALSNYITLISKVLINLQPLENIISYHNLRSVQG